MVNPRQRRKVKAPGTKVRRVSKKLSTRNLVINEPAIETQWDASKTAVENFKSIGLACRLNDDIGSAAMRKKVLGWQTIKGDVKERLAAEKKERMAALPEGAIDMTPLDEGEEEIFGELNRIFAKESTAETEVIKELEEKSKLPVIKKVHSLSANEVAYLEKLSEKHGVENFTAMAKDIKLNYLQKTPKQLQAMFSKL